MTKLAQPDIYRNPKPHISCRRLEKKAGSPARVGQRGTTIRVLGGPNSVNSVKVFPCLRNEQQHLLVIPHNGQGQQSFGISRQRLERRQIVDGLSVQMSDDNAGA